MSRRRMRASWRWLVPLALAGCLSYHPLEPSQKNSEPANPPGETSLGRPGLVLDSLTAAGQAGAGIHH